MESREERREEKEGSRVMVRIEEEGKVIKKKIIKEGERK